MASFFRITKWRGKELEQHVDSELTKRLHRAAIFLKNEIKKEISTKGVKCGTEDGVRSIPGAPPHIECGTLRQSIAHEVLPAEQTARVGTNIKYGKFLEIGTYKMAARPFLRPTLAKHRNTIRQILCRKMKGL